MSGSSLTPSNLYVLTAGGTGGHIFPAAALARELLARGQKAAFITDRRGKGFGQDLEAVETYRIAAAGVIGGTLLSKLRAALYLGLGYLQARRLLNRLKPKAVVAFGGYASVPAGLAAAHLGIPYALHEQNQVVGRANLLLASKAFAIATSFAEVQGLSAEQRGKTQLVGTPVRDGIAALAEQPYLCPDQDTAPLELLVTGGSQGASLFNDLIPEALARLPEPLRRRLKVTQQVRGEIGAVQKRYEALSIQAELKSFFDDMPERLAKAHLVICRSGASTISELAAAGRPAIFVPYPHAADNHQLGNAKAQVAAGAGWLQEEKSLTAETLASLLESLLRDPKGLSQAAEAAKASAHLQASEHLANLIMAKDIGRAA